MRKLILEGSDLSSREVLGIGYAAKVGTNHWRRIKCEVFTTRDNPRSEYAGLRPQGVARFTFVGTISGLLGPGVLRCRQSAPGGGRRVGAAGLSGSP